MSFENEGGVSPDMGLEAPREPKVKSKTVYTREFLLSFGELEICKNLPNGFDFALLSEFEDGSIQDRPRSHCSLPLQGFRHNGYGSSPPTRGDSSNYPRGVYGRQESRLSAWSDKDSDSHSDVDSDPGRRYNSQSRRFWQNPEPDGLLGSGSFPRPPGYAAGASTPKVQPRDYYQLNRSSEPYHPPRPFPAVPHSRGNTKDSYNDETFGASEVTSEDRAEEEKRRRASFELMRKEQQKVLLEKQKLNSNKNRIEYLSDITELVERKEESEPIQTHNELDSSIVSVLNTESGKSSLPSQAPTRPLVPPGFRTTVFEKGSVSKPLMSSSEKEGFNSAIEEIHLQASSNPVQIGTQDSNQGGQSVHAIDMSEVNVDKNNAAASLMKGGGISTSLPGLRFFAGLDDSVYKTSGASQEHEASDEGEVVELSTNKLVGDNNISKSNAEISTSILGKLFGNASKIDIGISSGFSEQLDSKPEVIWSPSKARSSKFAQWFHEDENKVNLSRGKPSDLLSLIIGGETLGSQVSEDKAAHQIFPGSSYASPKLSKNIPSSVPSASTEISEHNSIKHVILTCEDLEQTILSEYSERNSTSQLPIQEWSFSDPRTPQCQEVDNSATHHLLSLLQKGISVQDTSSEELSQHSDPEGAPFSTVINDLGDENGEKVNSSQTLTLETLFGTAFMKELQSVQAPVSVQRCSVGSAGTDFFDQGFSVPLINESPSIDDEIGSSSKIHHTSVLKSNSKVPFNYNKTENLSIFDGPQTELEFKTEAVLKNGGFDGAADIQLPEEESLFNVGDSMISHNPTDFTSGKSIVGKALTDNGPIDIVEKLAALNSGFVSEERSMGAHEGPNFIHGPYDIMEPDRQFHNLHSQQISLHRRPLFHLLDHHLPRVDSQMRFPEHIMQNAAPPNHHFPSNMVRAPIHHPETRVTGFDPPAHHQVMQQLQMQGNFPPPHLLDEFPRTPPMHSHPSNHGTGFVQDPNALHRFPFGHRRSNFGGPSLPLPGANGGRENNHSEALQRLMEMELRAKSKQMRHVGGGHNRGVYGHELDMDFQYR